MTIKFTAEEIYEETYPDLLSFLNSEDVAPHIFIEEILKLNNLEIKDLTKSEVGFDIAARIYTAYSQIRQRYPHLADDIFHNQMLKFSKNMDWKLVKSDKRVSLWEVFNEDIQGYVVSIGFGKKQPDMDSMNKFKKTKNGNRTVWRTAWLFTSEDRKGAEKFFDVQASRTEYNFI